MSDKLLIALLEKFSIQELRLIVDIISNEVDDLIYLQKDWDMQNYGGKQHQEVSFYLFANIIKKFIH